MSDIKKIEYSTFQAMLLEDTLYRLEEQGISLGKRPLKEPIENLHSQDFSLQIQSDAKKMQDLYFAFYCMENSVRELIVQRLSEFAGANWWEKKIPIKIRSVVEKLKEQEKKDKYHAQRSDTNIGYTTFGNLGQIIIANWDHFSDLFPDQAWISSRFSDLEKSRNIIMHTNKLANPEIDRIKSIVRDWINQIG